MPSVIILSGFRKFVYGNLDRVWLVGFTTLTLFLFIKGSKLKSRGYEYCIIADKGYDSHAFLAIWKLGNVDLPFP